MSYPLDNLGDYNLVRDDLKACDGSRDALYKSIGDEAIKKSAPVIALLAIGAYEGIKKALKGLDELTNKNEKLVHTKAYITVTVEDKKKTFNKFCQEKLYSHDSEISSEIAGDEY